TTVLLVEQNAHRALQAADHGYVLETGEVILEGPASQLLADERVVEAYLGETFDEPDPDPAVSDGGGRSPE
ncbi:MAG: hypothetical protein M3415_05025, partial [Actinomycetota bacterium]|nr:hypothetical protein [Actinomycetota bacterium]